MAIGCFARSMREGQTYATYVYMAAVFLGLGSFAEQAPPLKNFMIPILNTALLQREILTGTVQAAARDRRDRRDRGRGHRHAGHGGPVVFE